MRLGISPLLIGLAGVAYGTSSPELVVSVRAAVDGNSAIAPGIIGGSDICNIALILGLSALVSPLNINTQTVRLQIPVVIAASTALPLMIIDGTVGRFGAAMLLCGIVAYTVCSVDLARNESGVSAAEHAIGAAHAMTPLPWTEYLQHSGDTGHRISCAANQDRWHTCC